LLAINGDELQSDLSLPAAQPVPAFYKTIGHSPVVLPIDQRTKTVASEHSRMLPEIGEKFTPEYGFIFNGIGKVVESVTEGLLVELEISLHEKIAVLFLELNMFLGHWLVICYLEL
jgi:hypothetical protein